MQCMTADCVFENTRPAPDGTRLVGQAAVRGVLGGVLRPIPAGSIRNRRCVFRGDRCVVQWTYHWVRDGKPGHVRGVDVFRVRDGKVAEKVVLREGVSRGLGLQSARVSRVPNR